MRAHALFPRRPELDRLALRVDCGRGDPFFGDVERFVGGLPGVTARVRAGAHDTAYWTRVLPGQLAWLGARV